MDRWVTPPKRVTSPTWGPPPPCKQTLFYIDLRCFLPLEQSRKALLAAASQPRVFARLLVGNYYY